MREPVYCGPLLTAPTTKSPYTMPNRATISAGLLLYRCTGDALEVLEAVRKYYLAKKLIY